MPGTMKTQQATSVLNMLFTLDFTRLKYGLNQDNWLSSVADGVFVCVCGFFCLYVFARILSAPILLSDLSYFECLWPLAEHIFWQGQIAKQSNHVNEIRVQLTHLPPET